MPRDLLTEAKAPTLPPDLTRPSLAGLAWLLHNPKAWGEHLWDFHDRLSLRRRVHNALEILTTGPIPNVCGTVGCALGLGDRKWGYPAMRKFEQGLDPLVRSTLFLGGNNARHTYGCDVGQVTPTMVADAIDQYLARLEA